MTRRRAVLGALAVAAVLGAVAAALLLVEFDSPELGRAVLERAGTAAGARITARRFQFQLVRGLSLEGLEASGTHVGFRWSASADEVVLHHRLPPLLRREVLVDRVKLVRPQIRVTELPGAARAAVTPVSALAGAMASLAVHVAEMTVEDGMIEMTSAAAAQPTRLLGLDLRLRDLGAEPGIPLRSLRGRGDVRAAELSSAAAKASGLEGPLQLDQGRLHAGPLRFAMDAGQFEMTVAADLRKLPVTYTVVLRGHPLDLNALAGPRTAGGGGFGPGTVDMNVVGRSGGGMETLSGTGVFKLAAGRLPGTRILSAIEAALGRTRIVGAPYRPTQTSFAVSRGRVTFDGFRLETDALGLEAAGEVAMAGAVDLRVTVRAPRQGLEVPGVPPEALDVLTDDKGQLRVPLRVTGTREAPQVRPDLAALSTQAKKGAGRSLGSRARRFFQGLFGRERR